MLPWFLTDAALGAPEVRSQRTPNCQDSQWQSFPGALLKSNLMLSTSIWEECHDKKRADSYCDPNFVDMGQYVTTLKSGCIFPSQICLSGQPTAIFTRANVTAHDLGVNSRFKMTVTNRIYCSPISLDPFIHQSKQPAGANPDLGNFTLSIQDPRSFNTSESALDLQFSMWTDNCLDSGLEMWTKRSQFFFQILPAGGLNISSGTSKHIHPLLKFPNAQTFVFVLKAGAAWYSSPSPITDPLFAARKLTPQSAYYYPDREATAIGCGEQTQVCLDNPSGVKCYPWTKNLGYLPRDLRRDLRQFHDGDLDYVRVFQRNLGLLKGSSGLQEFLKKRLLLPNPLLLRPWVMDPSGISLIYQGMDAERQWISELAALFNKAMYWQKISALALVQNTPDQLDTHDWGKDSLCDRILFYDGDFTNINWIGMWITVGVLLLVCIISYGISLMEWASEKKFSLSKRETWRELWEIAFKRMKKISDRIRGIKHQDPPTALSTLPSRATRSPDDDPDDPDDDPDNLEDLDEYPEDWDEHPDGPI
jgi:hypothetical protein